MHSCQEQAYNQLNQILETSCQVDVLVNPARCEKSFLVEEKGKPETKSLKAAEFRQAIGERNRARNEKSE
jgi:hypothetical protein